MELPRDTIVTYSYDIEIGEVLVHTEMLVRCKDCKHYHCRSDKGGPYEWGHCEFFKTGMSHNNYCSCAERRDTTDDTVPTGFMSDWAREIDEQLDKLKIRKDGNK